MISWEKEEEDSINNIIFSPPRVSLRLCSQHQPQPHLPKNRPFLQRECSPSLLTHWVFKQELENRGPPVDWKMVTLLHRRWLPNRSNSSKPQKSFLPVLVASGKTNGFTFWGLGGFLPWICFSDWKYLSFVTILVIIKQQPWSIRTYSCVPDSLWNYI